VCDGGHTQELILVFLDAFPIGVRDISVDQGVLGFARVQATVYGGRRPVEYREIDYRRLLRDVDDLRPGQLYCISCGNWRPATLFDMADERIGVCRMCAIDSGVLLRGWKRCNKCLKVKPMRKFKVDKRNKDGCDGRCKACAADEEWNNYWKGKEKLTA
jgi:hypothetical protein